jgi:glycosyltransferase involved in cell wall biosynthesis
VSSFAKSNIAHHSGYPADRITPVPHGRDLRFGRVADAARLKAVRARHGIEYPFVLADALKNPAVLVEAWGRLPQQLQDSYRIVFFSRTPDPLLIVQEAVARGCAHLLVNPSRADLNCLYSMADAFVFPSWIEGFGMPLLEAMACGAPVIASDRPAIPEVAGDAALYADAQDAEGFARHLYQVLALPAAAAELRERGYRRVAQFSWPKTAHAILDAYTQAAALRFPARSVFAGGEAR